MKQLEDKSLHSAQKNFYSSMVLLIISFIYLISPIDIIPDILVPVGYADDILLLLASGIYSGYSYYKLKREREKEIS